MTVSLPVVVTEFSIHVCGEVSTTNNLPAGTTPSELAGSTTAGAAGTTPTTICSLINLLDRDDTMVTTVPEATGQRLGKGSFTIRPTDAHPEPKITVTPASPTTVMSVTIAGSNIKSVTVTFKDSNDNVLESVTLVVRPDVSPIPYTIYRLIFRTFSNIQMKFQGTFELPATSPEGVASIEVVITPLDFTQPIEVTDFSIHVCGEVYTTTSLPAGTTPSEITGSTRAGAAGSTTAGAAGSTTAGAAGSTTAGAAGSTIAGAAGSTTAGAAGTTPTTICSLINLLDKDDTTISTDPESTGARPGKGTFTLQPRNNKPNLKIIVIPASPTTVMGVIVVASNVFGVTIFYKDEDGYVKESLPLTKISNVCQLHFELLFNLSMAFLIIKIYNSRANLSFRAEALTELRELTLY